MEEGAALGGGVPDEADPVEGGGSGGGEQMEGAGHVMGDVV